MTARPALQHPDRKTSPMTLPFHDRFAHWAFVVACLLLAFQASASELARPVNAVNAKDSLAVKPVEMAEPVRLTIGKSLLLRLPDHVQRISVGNPEVADVRVISPRELYLLGKKSGTTNMLVWGPNGQATLRDLQVGMDIDALQSKLQELVPTDTPLKVDALADKVVISGLVSDGIKVKRIMALSEAFHGSNQVINMMRVTFS